MSLLSEYVTRASESILFDGQWCHDIPIPLWYDLSESDAMDGCGIQPGYMGYISLDAGGTSIDEFSILDIRTEKGLDILDWALQKYDKMNISRFDNEYFIAREENANLVIVINLKENYQKILRVILSGRKDKFKDVYEKLSLEDKLIWELI